MKGRKPKVIQVFEYQSLAYQGRFKNSLFTKDTHRSFEGYFKENDRTPFFELIPYGVRFKQYVGAIQIDGLLIEVLPKAGKTDDPKKWQQVLLNMLKTCQLLTAKETGVAQLKLKSNSILELYFELFLVELETLIHQGLIKKYRKKEGQQKALKGALVFSQHISQNLVHKERFYTHHTVYNHNHLLHQILFEALHLVNQLSNSSHLQDRIGRVLLDFPEQARIKANANHFSKLKVSRKTKPYQKAIEIARLLLLNYRPDLSSGQQNLLALMFDMNQLWEEYVYRILKKNLHKEWMVMGQQRQKFWEHKSIRPDIVLQSRANPEKTFVIDTKWKVIDNLHPADNDLKQMYVYNHHWKSSKSLLLYPKANDTQKDRLGTYSLPFKDKPHSCILGFVDVVDDKGLKQNLADQIMEKLI